LSRPPPKAWQKGVYGLVTVFGRYGWTKWESYLSDLEGGYEEPSPLMKRFSEVTSRLSTIHSVTALASFLRFLYNGQYRTLLDRFLRLRLVPTSAHTSREVSFEYLNRQLVWHAFTEFLLFLLPLVGIARWRRIIGRSWGRVVLFLKRSFGRGGSNDDEEEIPKGELGFLPERTCAICYSSQNPTAGASEAEILAATAGGGVVGSAQTDITNPYEAMPCGDVYCFVCIAQKIEADEGEGWTCLRCGEFVKECKPWNGDVLEEQPRPGTGSGKSVGFGFSGDGEKDLTTESVTEDMHEVEPMPTEDEDDEEHADTELNGQSTSSLVDLNGIGESAEWARASEYINGDGDGETETETNASATGSEYEHTEESEEDGEDADGFD
jgi:peroxin-2